ncbi:MAG: penicillin-binding protein 1C [Bacteroidia bacterium]|nr:MAG: penicillin-binding protein 1C [Bacteroidia bacterium]
MPDVSILKKIISSIKTNRKLQFGLVLIFILLILFLNCLPNPLFNDPTCTVLEDCKNNLIGAHIAADSQWRFPELDSVPEKFEKAIIQFEDKRFYYHIGFDIVAICRAMLQNISHGKIKSGGSTISMQTIRLARKGKARTLSEKIIELFLSMRLEMAKSKKEILALYASHAPFGGNIVGLGAASWRYFQRSPFQLSWAESALLAVLPNSPSLIHPGRNRKTLLKKRNRLLKKLKDKNIIDAETYELSIEEEIPEKPKAFPHLAPHLLQEIDSKIKNNTQKSVFKTTINSSFQRLAANILERHNKRLAGNGIHNGAVLVAEIESGKVLVYLGNVSPSLSDEHGENVDVIMAKRSTGSILKPFLYAAMLTSGDILPNTLVPDYPVHFGSYSPKNYNLRFDGAVKAQRAIARSLNIPAVLMLKNYGIKKFHHLLQKIGFTTIEQSPGHYGLSLILGGCEARLWEICSIYASMARSLNHFVEYSGKYRPSDYRELNYLQKPKLASPKSSELVEESNFGAGAIWLTFKAMLEVERPDEDGSWREFSSARQIAWKTGTSFGFRDAWAIGISYDYIVGVWAGNADGEGRPGLVGIKAAAPILFDVFDILPESSNWFQQPYDDMMLMPTCRESGFLLSPNCNNVDSTWIPETGIRSNTCPYHRIIHLDKDERYRVTSHCESVNNMVHKTWFVLPPRMECYYKIRNISYKTLPPLREDCLHSSLTNRVKSMQLIYPEPNSKIYVPIEITGEKGSVVFEVAHRKQNAIVFWHLDKKLIAQTNNFHQIALSPTSGKHKLTLLDQYGEKLTATFEVLEKENKQR